MAHIKEPLEIDFFVEPQPLTEAERERITDYIKNYKKKNKSSKKDKLSDKKKKAAVNA